MRNYKVKEDEIIRYQGPITLHTKKGDVDAAIILTDLNFIFVTEGKKFLWFKPKDRWQAFAKEDVKMFMGAPEIRQSGTAVKIEFEKEDRILVFEDKRDARIFTIKAWELITGKSVLDRSLDRLKQALDLVDDAVEINMMELIKEAKNFGETLKNFAGRAKNFFTKKN